MCGETIEDRRGNDSVSEHVMTNQDYKIKNKLNLEFLVRVLKKSHKFQSENVVSVFFRFFFSYKNPTISFCTVSVIFWLHVFLWILFSMSQYTTVSFRSFRCLKSSKVFKWHLCSWKVIFFVLLLQWWSFSSVTACVMTSRGYKNFKHVKTCDLSLTCSK